MQRTLFALTATTLLTHAIPAYAAEDAGESFDYTLNSLTPAAGDSSRIDAKRRIIPLEVTINKFAGYEPVKQLPGSAQYVDEETIERTGSNDITRVLKQVPGVNIQEEDGFGLRPNIGMRGGRIDRSSDITLMEDGILIAPAPYAAPAAYYFPRMERMTGIEVRKGSSAIKFGPRTTNGALNLLTRTVSDLPEAELEGAVGSYGAYRFGGYATNSAANDDGSFGVLAEFHHDHSDGFKKLDFVGRDTGYDLYDYMAKFRYKTPAAAKYYQELEAKIGYTDEDSDETYLGLTTEDFNINPFRRYAASQFDEMQAQHIQMQLTHYIEPMRDLSVSTTIYHNDFNRNWYKLQSVRAGGSKQSIATVLNDPATYAAHLAVLKGGNSAANGLQIRANNREYFARGIQTEVNYRANWFGIHNDVEMGLRYHVDEQDRFQHEDEYMMMNGVMTLTSFGAPGSQSNLIGTADAIAGYVINRMEFGQLALTPGVRYEYIDLETDNYGTSDPSRSGGSLQHFGSTITAVVPGIGIEYDITENIELLAGVHKGFAPPEPPSNAADAQNVREEESINYEAGVRYVKEALRGEVIAFYNDYENLLGADTFSGGGGSTGDQFNGGEVEVYGVEAGVGYDLQRVISASPWKLPANVTYTYTHTEFQNSFNSSFSEWGNVTAGDELPYIAPHQLSVSLGVEGDKWLVNGNARFMDEMRTVAGRGPLLENQSTDANFVVDLYAEYEAMEGVKPYVTIHNLFDQEYIAARRPAGVRPGAPQIGFAGIKLQF